MRSKQLLAVSLLLLFTTPGLSIIQPPRGDSALVNAKQIISDFKDWNWKRDQYLRFSKDYPFGWPSFDCKKPAHRSEAIDAHHLSPWDFGVIGAIGDSLTVSIRYQASQIWSR
ncbi:hypothetical protein GCK32_020177 [Trichostrongylus colubriformis]|uniref:Uncharacterized protein n=1 Tax=Trichostrongylus colubriformis TaxID=6319 RepID=A0AAN8G5A8_TRICO